MGLGGWGPVQARLTLNQALSLRPKTIVLGFYFGNDLFDAFKAVYLYDACHQMRDPDLVAGFAEMHRTKPFLQEWRRLYRRPAALTVAPPATTGFSPVRRFLSANVRLYGLARSLKNLTELSPRPAAADVMRLEELWHTEKASAERCRPQEVVYERESARTILCPGHRSLILDTGDPRIAEGLRLSKLAIAGIRDRCQDEGVAFYVLLIPTKEFVFAPLVEQRESSPSLDKLAGLESEVRRELSAWLRREGVPVIDGWPALRDRTRAGEQLYLPSVDDHPTGNGYRVIAEAVRAGLGL